ncbi:Methionine import ATP-binding protein MetN [compost metagenome]
MITLRHVTKSFHRPDGGRFDAVSDVSLDIAAGEIFGLIGTSGAGKSTLVRLINLLERPDQGDVLVGDHEMTRLSPSRLREARQDIGMIFQQYNLLANRTVAGNVALPLQIAGWKPQAIAERVAECLELVQLSDRAQHYPAQLSGGQKQRVGIARALAPRPKVILADEPTSALDPQTTRSLLETLKLINASFGVTIVIVTHEIAVVREICDRAALLDRGRLVEILSVTDGALSPQSTAAQRLLAS